MIVKDINQLKEKCVPVSALSYGEGEDIAKQLLDELSNFKSGIGLAANQIGINKRVCVINVTKKNLLSLSILKSLKGLKKHLYFQKVVYPFQINL